MVDETIKQLGIDDVDDVNEIDDIDTVIFVLAGCNDITTRRKLGNAISETSLGLQYQENIYPTSFRFNYQVLFEVLSLGFQLTSFQDSLDG